MQAVCSVATVSYLPGLIALYRSILRHQELPLYLMLVDADPGDVERHAEAVRARLPESARRLLRAVCPADVYGEATDGMRFYYDVFEFSTACKAGLHAWMQRRTEAERWLYLDADMLCFGSLAPIFSALDDHDILLTPHRRHPAANIEEDLNLLGNGAYNAGLLGVRRSPVSQAFTDWYLQALSHHCLNDTAWPKPRQFPCSTVLAADQRWLDLVPGYFPGVRITDRRGFNLGHWNVDRDRLNLRDGELHIGTDPVVLLHLSGWSAAEPHRFSRHARVDWSDDPAWHQVYSAYLDEIASLRAEFQRAYPYATYPDGSAITHEDRRRYLDEVLAGSAPPGSPFGQQARFLAARRPRKRKWHKRLRAWLRRQGSGTAAR